MIHYISYPQVVIFLYLIDHGETSRMILISNGVGLAIEVWNRNRHRISESELELRLASNI